MHLSLLLLVLLLAARCAFGRAAVNDDASVSRSAFPMDGDVAWVVQVSDLHISAYRPERAADLARLLGGALRIIRPHLLLVTGDITGIRNVSARVFDSHNEYKIVEEIPLQPVSSASADKPLFHAKWNAENYKSPSPTRYWLQVFVLDSHGVKTSTEQRPFSVEGNMQKNKICIWLCNYFRSINMLAARFRKGFRIEMVRQDDISVDSILW
ncbi:hypothetical protein PR202_gb19300 [Eleusine coracana subsp. coracana]|uniref:TMEM62 Ig-like domain-containing protein n=1 Tax=Eleusine coracana subsp. coracana TaxID=191504 RepID=A0AAV5F8H4_ELECO|nr:hypothetical protein PR202_gb19300 [Eleusine coracana subsp. coracana]